MRKRGGGGLEFPSVLLLGNGINRAYGSKSWDELTCYKMDDGDSRLPNPLKIILKLNKQNEKNIKNLDVANLFSGSLASEKHRKVLCRLLTVGFDHILTTNYSYELECASNSKSTTNHNYIKSLMKNSSARNRAENKYLLHTYNHCCVDNTKNKIWHIHGEARKPLGIVLSHYDYGNLFSRYKIFFDKRGNMYQKCQENNTPIYYNSWLDAFVMGNVFIIGFGFDFSEFDMWWLLNRKHNENAQTGEVYFFEPETNANHEKYELMKCFGVSVKHCNTALPNNINDMNNEEKNRFFASFYDKAIDEIVRLSSNFLCKENNQ